MRAILAISALVTCIASVSITHAAVPRGSLKKQEYRSLLAEVGYKIPPTEATEDKKVESKAEEHQAETKAEITRLNAENKALKEFLVSMKESFDAESKETQTELARIRSENQKRDRELRGKLVALAEKEEAVEARQDKLEKVIVTQPESPEKKAEEKERAQIADQKSKGMVTYGMFKSVRKENECVSRYRLHFWKCKANNDGACWKNLYTEFKNCLKVTVPEGRRYSEESKGILSKENEHVK